MCDCGGTAAPGDFVSASVSINNVFEASLPVLSMQHAICNLLLQVVGYSGSSPLWIGHLWGGLPGAPTGLVRQGPRSAESGPYTRGLGSHRVAGELREV